MHRCLFIPNPPIAGAATKAGPAVTPVTGVYTLSPWPTSPQH